MRDEDHGHTFPREVSQDLEELAGLLRRQDGRRLIENQYVRAAIESLQDLDPLLLADGDRLDARLRVDREVERSRELSHALARGAVVEQEPRLRRLGGEDDVLGHRHDRDQHEVLVHHADAAADRVLRRVKAGGLTLDQDLTLVGVVEPVENVHQG